MQMWYWICIMTFVIFHIAVSYPKSIHGKSLYEVCYLRTWSLKRIRTSSVQNIFSNSFTKQSAISLLKKIIFASSIIITANGLQYNYELRFPQPLRPSSGKQLKIMSSTSQIKKFYDKNTSKDSEKRYAITLSGQQNFAQFRSDLCYIILTTLPYMHYINPKKAVHNNHKKLDVSRFFHFPFSFCTKIVKKNISIFS